MSGLWPGLGDDGADLAALGLLRIATGAPPPHEPLARGWEQRAAEFVRAWSAGRWGGEADGVQPAAVGVAVALARWQAVLVLELHDGDVQTARAWLGERASAAGERAREVGSSRPVVPVVMALVWFGIDALASGASGAVPVCVLDPERAVRVVERCEAFLRREEDHAALVVAAAEATVAVLTERVGRGRVRAWLDEQAELLLDEVRAGAAPWWVPGTPGGG
jgi:hypothetical protein